MKIFSIQPLDRRRRANKLIVTILLTGFFLMLYLINPYSGFFHCRFNKLTGLECPTCGMTRSLLATARINIMDGFSHHLFGPLLFLFLLIVLLKYALELTRHKHMQINLPPGMVKYLFAGFGLAWFSLWIFRMLT